MKVLRVHLKGWTASFRYPGFAVNVQPTLPLPPLSTLYGLLSAARGDLVTPRDTGIGYIFQSAAQATDLELTYELESGLHGKTNVLNRHFLFEPELWLYLTNLDFAAAFRRPCHTLLLGRSTELAQVLSVEEINLERRADVKVGGSLWPYDPKLRVYGSLQALPHYFTHDIPRRAVGTRPWLLVEREQRCPDEVWYDAQLQRGLWMHEAT
jgi:CRISPR-associated protein Cas5t